VTDINWFLKVNVQNVVQIFILTYVTANTGKITGIKTSQKTLSTRE